MRIFLYSLLFFCVFLFAKGDDSALLEEEPSPWLTGPLIAPTGTAIPLGNAEIYYFVQTTTITGLYDHHWQNRSLPSFCSFHPQIYILAGLTEWMDIQIVPQTYTNFSKGHSSTHFGDLPLGFDFQLYSAESPGLFPGIKASVMETFPTGKYRHLNPHKETTDLSGLGTFSTAFNLVFYKIYHIKKLHFLSATLSFNYALNSAVSIRGLSAYGGDKTTHGTVYPGAAFTGILSFEYSLTRNWALALDNVYVHTNKNRFSGSTEEPVGNPSSEQISFAPAIEYNFSEDFGIIAGAYVSAWGRNANVFRDGIISFVCNY